MQLFEHSIMPMYMIVNTALEIHFSADVYQDLVDFRNQVRPHTLNSFGQLNGLCRRWLQTASTTYS